MPKEEMLGWGAVFELEHEEYEKGQKQAQTNSALKGKRGRIR